MVIRSFCAMFVFTGSLDANLEANLHPGCDGGIHALHLFPVNMYELIVSSMKVANIVLSLLLGFARETVDGGELCWAVPRTPARSGKKIKTPRFISRMCG